MLKERRHYFRMAHPFPITVHCIQNDQVIQGHVLNLSAGGLLASLTHLIPLEAHVSLHIALDRGKSFFALAKAARIQNKEKNELAFTFTRVEEEELLNLFEALSQSVLL